MNKIYKFNIMDRINIYSLFDKIKNYLKSFTGNSNPENNSGSVLVVNDYEKSIFHPITKHIYETFWFYTELKEINLEKDDVHELFFPDYHIFKRVSVVTARLDVKVNDDYLDKIKSSIGECLTLNVTLAGQAFIESIHSVVYNEVFKICFKNENADELINELPSIIKFVNYKSNTLVDALTIAFLIEGIIIPILFNFIFTLKFNRKVYKKTICPMICQLNTIIIKDEVVHRDLFFLIMRTYFKHLINDVYNKILNFKPLIINMIDEILGGEDNFAGTPRSEFIYLLDKLIEIYDLSFKEDKFPTTYKLTGTILENLINDSLTYTKQFEVMNGNYSKNEKFKLTNNNLQRFLQQ